MKGDKKLEEAVREEFSDYFKKLVEEKTKPLLEPGDMTIERLSALTGYSDNGARGLLLEKVKKGELQIVEKKNPESGHLTQVFVEVKK